MPSLVMTILMLAYRSGRDSKCRWPCLGRNPDHRGHANHHRAKLDRGHASYRYGVSPRTKTLDCGMTHYYDSMIRETLLKISPSEKEQIDSMSFGEITGSSVTIVSEISS